MTTSRAETGDPTTQHDYSPSNVPSVDGTGCLYRERNDDGTYSLRTCQRPEHDPVHSHDDRTIRTADGRRACSVLMPNVDREYYDQDLEFDPPHAYARLEGQSCGCASRYYGGDCAHTTSPEQEDAMYAELDAQLEIAR